MVIEKGVVQTSDPEELEEHASSKPGYWFAVASDIAGRRDRVRPQSQRSKSDSPPRKRRKLDIPPNHPSTPLLPLTNLPDSSPFLQCQPAPEMLRGHSAAPPSSLLFMIIPSPARLQPRQQPSSYPSQGAANPLQDPNLADEDFVQGSSGFMTRHEVARRSSTGSPLSSPDPLLLFTPQRGKSPSPGRGRTPASSSPLTPTSSPIKPSENRDCPPADLPPLPASPAREKLVPTSPRQLAAIAQEKAAERARYSLRARNARQLNPYEYDKLLYKRQMRANPDALVKVVSPSRPRQRQRSISVGVTDASSGAEDEYNAREDDDVEDEDTWTRRRSKGKEREVVADEERVEKPTWLPEAFRESSSSSEEDDDLIAGLELCKKPEKRLRKKRPKPFPMSKKDLQRSVSPAKPPQKSHPSSLSPRPRPRPRPRPQLRAHTPAAEPRIEDDDDEPLYPGSTWRRRRSVTFSSPTRKSPPHKVRSPGAEDDLLVRWDDEFARGQSPLKVSQIPGLDFDDPVSGESSQGHDPPPTSSELNEVIDISTDSDSNSDANSADGERPSSGGSLEELDRKRMRVLNRMMPSVMIKKLQAQDRRKATTVARTSASVERDDDEHEGGERPLRPGESRRRMGGRTLSSRSAEIRGDSESSDVDVNIDVDMAGSRGPSPLPGTGAAPRFPSPDSSDESGLSSSDISVIEPVPHQLRPKYRPNGGRTSYLQISEDEDSLSSDVSDVDEAVGQWVSGNKVKKMRRVRDDGEVREVDLIDRMLSRTNVSSGSRARQKRKGGRRRGDERGRGRDGGGRGRSGGRSHGGSGLRITTSGAKRYGAGRQTLLPFKRLPTPEPMERVELDGPPSPASNEVQFIGDETAKTKKKAAKQKAKQAGLYVFPAGNANTHLISGRANGTFVTVDEEVSSRGQRAATLHNEGRARPPVSKSKTKLHRQSSKRTHAATLEEYWDPGNDQYEQDGFVVADGPVPQRSPQHKHEWDYMHRVTIDLGVHPLPAGIAFLSTTYLGHGWLHELINLMPGTHDVASPPSCSMFDCFLYSEMSVQEFAACLDSISDQLRNLILGGVEPSNYEACQKWQVFLHSVSQHLSLLLVKSEAGAYASLTSDVESFVERLGSLMEEPVEILPDDETPNPLALQVLWFLVEASCRVAIDRRRRSEAPDKGIMATTLKALTEKLWEFSFCDTGVSFNLTREDLTKASTTQQIAELWVCLVNLTSDKTFQTSFLPQGTSFWSTCLQVLHSKGLRAPHTDIRSREAMWKSVFSLCALSQFSIHGHTSMNPRITPSWQVVASILERAPLSVDTVADAALSRRVLRKRDEYVRVLVSRCLWLNVKWHWRLDLEDAPLVFNSLLTIFKSRRFANLVDEPSDFPSFLRHNNLALLQEKKSSDTAFTLFLKLVIKAAEDMRKDNPQLAQTATIPPKLKKILSLAVPVGSVSFTKVTPPTSHDLSMLYNRFSAVAVAIYLEPIVANLKHRLSNARRYVNFRDTDNETRRACIRGAMHLAILLCHLRLPLTDVLDWLGDMTNILIDEYQSLAAAPSQGKNWIVLSIQLLLGCVRRVLETPSMDPEQREHKYPDPALLQGPWVTRVFSTETNLSTISFTGDEIRRLVQAFLDARSRVIPRPRRPQPRAAVEDSQESQYDYGQFDLDMDDPELLAALGEPVGQSDHQENKEKEKVVWETIDKHISPAIYRLVCKHFNDPIYQRSGELSFQDADRWIDCWVGCASVVVQNGKKDWTFYLNYGPQSWEKIIERDWRRRVGLRFMFMVLRLDPPAYTTFTDQFLNVLFESMATPNVTLEHEYASLLFSIDRLHHPLLVGLAIDPPGEDGDYHMSKYDFIDKRPAILEAMIKNLSGSLDVHVPGDQATIARNNIHITSVMALLSTMKDIYERFDAGTVTRTTYVVFCKQIFDLFSRYPNLSNNTRLTTLMAWLRNVS